MSEAAATVPTPPISASDGPSLVEALRAAHELLDAVSVLDPYGRVTGWASVTDLAPEELAEAVRLGAGLEGRVSGLRLHCVAAAEVTGAVEATAAADAGAWAAQAGRNRSRSWGRAWLANQLEESYPATRAALASGTISEQHAAVIAQVQGKVPDSVRESLSEGDWAGCEEQLVAKAATMSPGNLRKAARRFLAPICERFADAHEETVLRAEEDRAEAETWLTLGDNGDGTWSGKFTVPALHGAIFKKALDVLGSPRRKDRLLLGPDGRTRRVEIDPTVRNLGYTDVLGLAFCELLEHLPETGHARTGISIVVHLDEAQLTDRVGGVCTDTGTPISTHAVRRLACDAGLLPMVLSGASVPLDLGTRQRLFTKAQAIALSATYDSCAAEGCERPYAWTEIHHLTPWSRGGPTDLANAVPLCGHHHRCIHDERYVHQRQPDGTITFEHRRRRARAPAPAA